MGSLEVGKRADLILLRTGGTHVEPVIDPVRTAVMQAGVNDVEMVMVNGRVVKRDGRLACDQQGLESRLSRAADRIVSAAADQGLDDAYDYVRAAFPLDTPTAVGARLVGKLLQIRRLDDIAFRVMLAQAGKGQTQTDPADRRP